MMMMMTPAKKEVRKVVRATLAKLDVADITQQSAQITRQLVQLPRFVASRVVGVYLNTPTSEATTGAILEHCFAQGKRVVVPFISPTTDSLEMVELASMSDLATFQADRWGIPTAPTVVGRARALVDMNVDVVVTPGLYFDRAGRRLGHGKAYYDRFIKASRAHSEEHNVPRPYFVVIALAQQLSETPVPFVPGSDELVDAIVTPHEVITIHALAALSHGLAGSMGGVVSSVVFQPLDVIKTRQQQGGPMSRGMAATAANVVREQGPRALWRGTMPTVYRTLPGSAMYFTLLRALQRLPLGMPTDAHNALAGALARALAGVILNPVTVVKTRYESNLYGYRNTWGALVSIWRAEGIHGLLSGAWATIYRDAPYAGIYFATYERLKRLGHLVLDEHGTPAAAIHFGSGVLGGFTATLTTQPFDVIKTRVQVQPTRYPSFSRAVVLISSESGVTGFFRGMMPRLVRKSLMTASTWTVYEEIQRRFTPPSL